MKIYSYEVELIKIQKAINKHKALLEIDLKELGLTLEELQKLPTAVH